MPDPTAEKHRIPDAPGLADPKRAAIAWGRFRRLMGWMALVAVVAIGAAILYLREDGQPFPIHMLIATIAGVGFTVLLGSALMLLVFLSSGSGHDDAVGDQHKDHQP